VLYQLSYVGGAARHSRRRAAYWTLYWSGCSELWFGGVGGTQKFLLRGRLALACKTFKTSKAR